MGYRFGYFKCGISNKGHCIILSQLDQKNITLSPEYAFITTI
jgi:hypothetical protein